MSGYGQFLQQSEADSIFADISGVDLSRTNDANGEKELKNGVRTYNLGSPDRVVRKRMKTFELINERFMRRLRIVLFNFMRRNADVSVGQINVVKYSEFERNLPVPSNLNIVSLKPLRGSSLFAFDPKLVFMIVETLFGGQGNQGMRIEGRDFTLTEQRIIQRLLGITLQSYVQAWEPVYPIEAEYIRSEMHTKFASVAGENDVVVVTPFNIEFGSSGGTLHVCLPYSMIEPVRDLLSRPFQETDSNEADARWSGQINQQMRRAQVQLAARFAQIESSIGHLLALKKGDVLPIDVPTEVIASVDDVPTLRCGYGTHKNRYALRVIEHLNHDHNVNTPLATNAPIGK